jgi:hypothetical protein
MKIYKRNCPKCNKELETKNKHYYNKAVIENKLCLSCSLTGREFSEEHKSNLSKNHANVDGENNPFYNKRHSEMVKSTISKVVSEKYKDPELRKRVSEIRKEWHRYNDNSFKGKTHSDSTKENLSFLATKRFESVDERNRISQSLIGNIPWNCGKTGVYNVSTIDKMSKSAQARIIRQGNNQIHSYNPKSIPILEEYAKENGYNIQHAENGGEYQVPNTTFFVDAYDVENNVVIEYDENYHLNENQVEKDRKRQQIIGNILKCKFVRILQSGEIRIFDYSKNK